MPFVLPRKSWVYHPNCGDKDTHFVDVAAMKVRSIKNGSIKAFRCEPEDPNDQDNQLPLKDSEPPAPILVFGFPADIGFLLLEQRPLGRLGIVSMKAEREFVKYSINSSHKFAEERCCIIDARMFPGNSGSPVMNHLRLGDSKPRLLGLVVATNTLLDFGIIEPVSRIRETLDMAKKQPASGRWKPVPKKEAEQMSTSKN